MGRPFRYFLLYKPCRVLSQFTDPVGGKRTLKDLHPFPKDVYPVGRLDEDSEGLLLLTNDPAANQRILGNSIEKEYFVQVEGLPDEAALDRLRSGVEIKVRKKRYLTRPAKVKFLPESPQLPPREPPIRFRKSVPDTWLSIVLTEGKNRQVRKMTAAVGHPTLRLVRYRFHKWEAAGMKSGEVIELKGF